MLARTCIGAIPRSNSYYGAGRIPIFLDRVHCTGTEDRLIQCGTNGLGVIHYSCDHGDDAGVECPRMYSCSVKLLYGISDKYLDLYALYLVIHVTCCGT